MNAFINYNLCRLCLCRGGTLVDIFEENGKRDFMIQGTIQDLLRFQVLRRVGVPWLACASCLEKLGDFRLFKQRCIECKIAFEGRVMLWQEEAGAEGSEQFSNEVFLKLMAPKVIKIPEARAIEESVENGVEVSKQVDTLLPDLPIKEEIEEASPSDYIMPDLMYEVTMEVAEPAPDMQANQYLKSWVPVKEEIEADSPSECIMPDEGNGVTMEVAETQTDEYLESQSPIEEEPDDIEAPDYNGERFDENIDDDNDGSNWEQVDAEDTENAGISESAVSGTSPCMDPNVTIDWNLSRKRSSIWKFFKVTTEGQARCYSCSMVYSYKGDATSLYRHMKLKHPGSNVGLVQRKRVAKARDASGASRRECRLERVGEVDDVTETFRSCTSPTKEVRVPVALMVDQCTIGKELSLVCHQTILTRRMEVFPVSALSKMQVKSMKDNTGIKKMRNRDVICAHHFKQFMRKRKEDSVEPKKDPPSKMLSATKKGKTKVAPVQKASFVWTFFQSSQKNEASCCICRNVFSCQFGTSNLYRHLKSRHPEEFETLSKMEMSHNPTTSDEPTPSDNPTTNDNPTPSDEPTPCDNPSTNDNPTPSESPKTFHSKVS